MKLAKVLILGLFAIAILAAACPAQAQTGTIEGTATDSTTGQSLPGVNVVIAGTQQGAATDAEGRFTISGLEPGTYTLLASFVGYDTKRVDGIQVTANDTTAVNIALAGTQVGLEQVVVIGYGEQRREDVTGAVSTVDLDNLRSMPLTSPDQALQGQIAGVVVKSSSGIPGGGPAIRVRGTGSFGASSGPLYVVDGFALPQSSAGTMLTRNPLATIPVEDIASITVLKDASATAIYGSRGSNGVVIVTTKSGQSGEVDINVSASTSLNQVMDRTLLNSANAREFAKFQQIIWQGRVEAGVAEEVPVQYRNPEQYGEGTYWLDEITRTAMAHNVHVSVSGGTDELRSYFSAGYTREEGIMLNSNYNRVSMRANLEADLAEGLTAGLHLAPTYSVRNLSWEGGEGRAGAGGVPWMVCPLPPVYKEDGTYLPQPGAPGYGEDGALGYCPGVWSQPNPVLWLMEEEDQQKTLRALGSAYLDYAFAPGLTLRQTLNVDYRTSNRREFRPSIIGETRVPPPTVPSGFLQTSNYVNWLSETTLNWTSELGPGTIDALAGFTAQNQIVLSSNFSGDFPDDEIQTLNVASNLNGTSNEEGWSLLSGLARVNYNLLDRFVFTGTVRADGSSRFGRLNRWGTFPSAAVAWNVHNESFMSGLEDAIPELRLRLSYGITGNNSIGNYAALGVVGEHDYVFNNNVAAGRVLSTLANPFLAWERTREVNFGLNASLYEYRLTLAVNVYRSETTDLLLQRELPRTSGFANVTQNLGKMRNRGIEFSLSAVNVDQEDFNWTTTFNFSLNRNKILQLPGGNDVPSDGPGPAYYISREGYPIGTYVGYIVDGLYTAEEIANACGANVTEGCVMTYPGGVPGAIQFRDLNHDGILTPQVMVPAGDFAILGDAYPDFTFGLTNTMSFGRFDLRVFFTGSFGNDNLRAEFFRTARNIDGLFNVDAAYVHNMWISPEQPGDGLTPTPLGGAFGRQQYRDSGHSLILSDASNIWLRNVTLSYNFEGGTLAGSSLYLSGSNLFILTPYPDNPDVTGNGSLNQQPGLDFGNYPLPRTFTLGLRLSL